MGAAVCTLLWRVSRQQESVVSLLGGVGKTIRTTTAAEPIEQEYADITVF